jgi:hypothetical protein
MKAPLTAAAAISLLLSSAPLLAAEPQFNLPDTVQAGQDTQVFAQVAHVLPALSAGETQVSNVWLYPTDNADTVFAQYALSQNDGSGSVTQHLALVTVRDNRVVGLRELTAPSGNGAHWSASLGNGHTSENTTATTATHGSPAAPHWTAAIGRGTTTWATAPESDSQPSVTSAHWTSKIGTGHASDSDSHPTPRATTVVAGTARPE